MRLARNFFPSTRHLRTPFATPFRLLSLVFVLAALAFLPTAQSRPSKTSAPWPSNPKAGQQHAFDLQGQTFKVRYIPKGSFRMGSPLDEEGRGNTEGPQRTVTITRGFWMLETEVTQAQYKALTDENPSDSKACGGTCPVENVSWHTARAFADKLSQAQGLPACTATDTGVFQCTGWRFPTEAEWEYAARAGTTGPRHGKFDDIAWHNGNSVGKTHPVGKKQANAWGLYDMLGNVAEWTLDIYQNSYAGLGASDPLRTSGRTERVTRGSSRSSGDIYVRSAARSYNDPADRYSDLGFRLLRY